MVIGNAPCLVCDAFGWGFVGCASGRLRRIGSRWLGRPMYLINRNTGHPNIPNNAKRYAFCMLGCGAWEGCYQTPTTWHIIIHTYLVSGTSIRNMLIFPMYVTAEAHTTRSKVIRQNSGRRNAQLFSCSPQESRGVPKGLRADTHINNTGV